MKITVKELSKLCKGKLLTNGLNKEVYTVTIDSRVSAKNGLFVPLKGENHDGHKFIKDAVNNGCNCIFIEDETYVDSSLDCEFILNSDNLAALQELAENYRQILDIDVIAITGSNGKTTTKDLIFSIFSQTVDTVKTQGNYNNEIGLPLMLTRLERSNDVAVLELGMSDFGEIDFLARLCKPTFGVITNIGESHIEYLKSKEGIAKAKGELLHRIKSGGKAILNGDDPYLKNMKDVYSETFLYGFEDHNHLVAYNIEQNNTKVSFSVKGLGKDFSVSMPILGEHNVLNALAAILCALLYGVSEQDIIEGLKGPNMTGMRTEVLTSKSEELKVISDCYNASLTSTNAALKVLSDYRNEGRKVAIVGDMLELGQYTEAAHKEAGQKAAENNVDFFIAVGQYAEFLASGWNAHSNKSKALAFENTDQLLKNIGSHLTKGDLVLVKGSRGLKLEKVVKLIREEF
ncbi:UDP-N-acetylmuramoyl-tripeptide--D-alanyl-D-alanine ligase [Proteinivorax hydrogeniformans]|uniref:UDP-N-acetylmuramoyl-tripeptide--D-alanyl-D-alanine ligase n=1 Tax=Proteinivorax hydrogeniformans TaxID=1826727 RepID=A0AAU8HPM3_9FIRM